MIDKIQKNESIVLKAQNNSNCLLKVYEKNSDFLKSKYKMLCDKKFV